MNNNEIKSYIRVERESGETVDFVMPFRMSNGVEAVYPLYAVKGFTGWDDITGTKVLINTSDEEYAVSRGFSDCFEVPLRYVLAGVSK